MSLRGKLGALAVVAVGASFGFANCAFADEAADSALMTKLGLMRGHLHVGMEVSKSGDAKQASLHFHHPKKEIYAEVEADLKARGADGLGAALDALEKAGDGGGDVAAAYAAVVDGISKAEGTVSADMRGSPKFVIGVAVAMMEDAASEFAAAYPADKLAELEEYQDSMGFVVKADELIDTISDKIKGADYDAMDADIQKLKSAWPAIAAPDKPVMMAADVKALVDKIKAAAAKF